MRRKESHAVRRKSWPLVDPRLQDPHQEPGLATPPARDTVGTVHTDNKPAPKARPENAKSWAGVHCRVASRRRDSQRPVARPPGIQHTRQASRCVVAGPLARTQGFGPAPAPARDCLPTQFTANFLSVSLSRVRASERASQPIPPSLTYSAGCGGATYFVCLGARSCLAELYWVSGPGLGAARIAVEALLDWEGTRREGKGGGRRGEEGRGGLIGVLRKRTE